MKKFVVNCDFGGQLSPFSVYIGNPDKSKHALQNQSSWLGQNRGGNIPGAFMDALSKLKEIADRNQVLLEDLCVYAVGFAQQELNGGQNPEDGDPDLEDLVLEDSDDE